MNAVQIPQKVTISSVLANAECCTSLPRSSIDQLKAEHAALVAVVIAVKRLLDLANDPAGGTCTLKETFGFPSHYRDPELEGAALLLAMKNVKI